MFARTFALCAASLVFGIVLVLACGDDSPSDADAAAACDCPEAEPPLSGRIVFEEHPGHIISGAGNSAGSACFQVEGGVYPRVLSGGCRIVDDTIRESGNLRLIGSYKTSVDEELGPTEGWACTYDNATTETVDIMVTLTCLQPAPASN